MRKLLLFLLGLALTAIVLGVAAIDIQIGKINELDKNDFHLLKLGPPNGVYPEPEQFEPHYCRPNDPKSLCFTARTIQIVR